MGFRVWHVGGVATDSERLDLYDGLKDVLGTDPATTLMTCLPDTEAADLLTRSEFQAEMTQFRTELRGGLADMNKRIDRVLLTLVAGLFVIFAAVLTSGHLL